jgi:hypothetical protein
MAMGAETPYLIVETEGNRRFPLLDPTTLGRLPENALPLDDPGCSSRHAVIRRSGGCWILEDLGSTNGTWINGQQLDRPHTLKEGDRVQLGAQVLRVGGLGAPCRKCGREIPPAAAFCPGCGLALQGSIPSPTLVMRPPSLPPALPPPLPPAAAPPPVPVPAVPAAPAKKKRGCWLSCCLMALVLLIVAGVGAWFLWQRFFGNHPSPILGKALEFRQAARFDTPGAMASWAEPKAQQRFQELNENLWPAVNPGLGWAFFFETSIVDSGTPSEDHLPVLFYNPWVDVALITSWSPDGRLSDLEVLAGDCLRRGGELPVGGGRGWLTQGAYGPAAVGGLTARTLLAFEKDFKDGPWISSDLRRSFRAWKDPATLEASSLACGLQFAQSFQELVRFSRGDAREAYVDVLKQGAAGQAEVLTALASSTTPEAAASLKALPPEQWSAFKVTSYSDLGEKALILAHHSGTPDLFLGIVLLRNGGAYVPLRLDLMSFNACYDATR